MKKVFTSRGALILIIGYFVTFICADFIPDLILRMLNFSLWGYVITIALAILILIILLLVRYILENKIPVNYEDIIEIKHWLQDSTIETLLIYATSSAFWLDSISSIKNVHIKQCTVLIRNVRELNSEAYQEEVNRTVDKWKEMRNNNIIEELKIYEFNHIPDHYYGIIDDKILLTGVNVFDENDSTLQYGGREPQTFFDNSDSGKTVIESYKKQFLNYLERYKNNLIYDSKKG